MGVQYHYNAGRDKKEGCYGLSCSGFLSSTPVIFVHTSLEEPVEDMTALKAGREPDLGRWSRTNYTSISILELKGLEIRCCTLIFNICLPNSWCLSESCVIRHAPCNVCGAAQTGFSPRIQSCYLCCHGSLAFCLTKLEKEMAFVICNISITLWNPQTSTSAGRSRFKMAEAYSVEERFTGLYRKGLESGGSGWALSTSFSVNG